MFYIALLQDKAGELCLLLCSLPSERLQLSCAFLPLMLDLGNLQQ